jgi:hypothetical protein
VIEIETVQALLDSGGYLFKNVASDTKAMHSANTHFANTIEHQHAKVEGLSYGYHD